jgi:hypothetical protein
MAPAIHAHAPGWLRCPCCTRYLLLVDAGTNSVLGQSRVSLAEAEAVGYARPELVEEWAELATAAATASSAAAGGGPEAMAGATASKESKPGRAAAAASKFMRSYNNSSSANNVSGSSDAKMGRSGEDDVPAPEAGQLVEIMFMAPPKWVLNSSRIQHGFIACHANCSSLLL